MQIQFIFFCRLFLFLLPTASISVQALDTTDTNQYAKQINQRKNHTDSINNYRETAEIFNNEQEKDNTLPVDHQYIDNQYIEKASFTEAVYYDEVRCSDTFCVKAVSCPSNKPRITHAKAACNLEWGRVTTSELEAVANFTMKVVLPSGQSKEGICNINYAYGYEATIHAETARIAWILEGRSDFVFGCKEHDPNGGECHMRVKYICE